MNVSEFRYCTTYAVRVCKEIYKIVFQKNNMLNKFNIHNIQYRGIFINVRSINERCNEYISD